MTCGAVDPACKKCRLSKGRGRVVAGVGPCDSSIMFVGEAPGKDEDIRGEPFVGRAGRILDEALREAGVERSEVRISNIVKCRPPGNRRPREDEKSTCASLYLEMEMDEVAPEVICALGQTAAEFLAGKKLSMSDAVGKEMDCRFGRRPARLFVTYHPAACLYQRKNLAAFKRGVKKSLVAAGLAKR